MILIPLTYKIDDFHSGSRVVDGFAVKSDLPVRFCVHQENMSQWICDHYDTGAKVGPAFASMEDAAMYGEAKFKWAITEDKLNEAIEKFYEKLKERENV